MPANKHLFDNYAHRLRGFDGKKRYPVVPRDSFTFFIEFGFNPELDNAKSYDELYNQSNSIFVKSFTKPGFSFDVETLRSYNTNYKLKKKKEFNDLTLVVYDDTRSKARQLINNYDRHYHADYNNASRNQHGTNLSHDGNNSNKSLAERLVTSNNDVTFGLKSRSADKSKFFSYIRLYDLGTNPDAMQIYTIYDPIFKSVDAVTLDYTDGSGMQEVNISIEYTYYDTYENNDSAEFHKSEGLFAKHLNKSVIEERLPDEKYGSIVDDVFKDDVGGWLSSIGVDPGDLVQAVQASIQGGELNLDDLRENLFEAVADGTPIQNIRNVITNVRQIEQAISQGRFTDIIPLLGSGLGQLKDFGPNGIFETINGVKKNILSEIDENTTWIERHLNPVKGGGNG